MTTAEGSAGIHVPPSGLLWTTLAPGRRDLRARGYKVLRFRTIRRRHIDRARLAPATRSSLDSPAQKLFALYAGHPQLAVLGVKLASAADLHDLYAYVVEPALRRCATLLIEADAALEQLRPADFVDDTFGYAWVLERLRWLAGHPPLPRAAMSSSETGQESGPELGSEPGPKPGSESGSEPDWLARLDEPQRRAVLSHDGVTQVIAPAGSGKTLVLISRVRELLRRGVSPDAILCLTFNTKAKDELQLRLARESIEGVEARTFHSAGRLILQAEGRGRPLAQPLGVSQWRSLAKKARDGLGERGTWVEPDQASAVVTGYKLGDMIAPDEAEQRAEDAWRAAAETAETRRGMMRRGSGGRSGAASMDGAQMAVTAARIYALYQQQLDQSGTQDFDDMIVRSVGLLRGDAALRTRWQQRWQCLLVDEYQDIEPAQEMLVRLLAAPQDCLFCVGDEDQTLYAWRRASVETMLDFDRVYPGLQRVALARCYRCPEQVVECARWLVEHNRYRFPKAIKSAQATLSSAQAMLSSDNAVAVIAGESLQQGAELIAQRLANADLSQAAVVARTSRLLRLVAVELAAGGIGFQGPRQIAGVSGAHAVLGAYLRVLADRRAAADADIAAVLRVPNRHLPAGAQTVVADRLRQGANFAAAVAGLGPEEFRHAALNEAAMLLDDLSDPRLDAAEVIWRLRVNGRLDEHFVAQEGMATTEQVEVETLAAAQCAANGATLGEFAATWATQDRLVSAGLAAGGGIELTTVHGAKGREWPTVYLFGADERQLPHASSADDIEAERRIAYVAFTRARERLVIVYTAGQQSRFLVEAGLVAPAPRQSGQ